MALWPFKSKPKVTPFADPFSAELVSLSFALPTSPVSAKTPDNLYLSPSCITIQLTTGGGIRSTTGGYIYFSRGGLLYAGSLWGAVTNNHTYSIFWLNGLNSEAVATATQAFFYPLPRPLFIYPSDVITIYNPSLLAGDSLDAFTIHGKSWEVY